jgi:hypothetical protein
MTQSVVAKMQVWKVEGEAKGIDQPYVAKVEMGAVWEGSTEKQALSENAIFGNATPWGQVVLGIKNPTAAEFFKPGKRYYVTFTEAPDA